MANPIKYTNATQSNSIKTSNFAIGVNNGGYGPTSITNFYNGKTPNVGGYTVYVSNGVGSPSVFVAGNDANLITLSNQLGGSGITTISGALNFFNSSSTMLCTNMDYPNIVTSGLVLNLDAAYTPSYPKNGTTWTDLSGNGNNGTLVNGPSFSSLDGGSIGFDGSNDYVTILNNTTVSFTIGCWINTTATSFTGTNGYEGNGIVWSDVSGIANDFVLSILNNKASWFTGDSGTTINSTTTINTGSWFYITVVKNGTNSIKQLFINGVLESTGTSGTSTLTTNPNINIGGNTLDSKYFNGKIAQVKIYNRTLTQAEILQNYYAGLQRFIPTDSLVLSLDGSNTDKQVATASTAYDMSGNNNNGTLNNGVALVSDGQRAFSFDGVNDVVTTSFNTLPSSTTWTVWVKRTQSINAYNMIMGMYLPYFAFRSNGDIHFSNSIGGVQRSLFATPNLANNVWYFMSFVSSFSGGNTTMLIYLNGSLQSQRTDAGQQKTTTDNNFRLGGWTNTGTEPFKGNIGQVGIYNRVLTATEISTIYTASKSRYTPSTTEIKNVFKSRLLEDLGLFEAESCLEGQLNVISNQYLLESASLMVTANAYKEGKLYSVVPFELNGDMVVTRATRATRVNSDGLIEQVPYNILIRTEEFENTIWVKSNVTITSNSTLAPNGTLTADTITVTGTSNIHVTQNAIGTTNNFYIASCYFKKENNDNARLSLTDQSIQEISVNFNLSTLTLNTISSSGVGWDNISYGFSSVQNGFIRLWISARKIGPNSIVALRVGFSSSTIGSFDYIWGAQLVPGTQPREYLPVSTGFNIPRIDYSNGSCPSILVEPQRTNFILNSTTLTTTWFLGGIHQITDDLFILGSGKNLKNLINDSINNNASSMCIRTTVTNIIKSGNNSLSFFVKKTSSHNSITVWGFISGGSYNINFNVDTLTVTYPQTATRFTNRIAGIKSMGNNIYYCYESFSSDADYNITLGFSPTTSGSNLMLIGQEISIAGFQMEQGQSPTSYIPTTTATVTRNADVISKTSATSLIGQTEGTILVKGYQLQRGVILRISNSLSTNNQISIFCVGVDGRCEYGVRKNNISVSNSSVVSPNLQTNKNIIIKYSQTSIKVFINGVLFWNYTYPSSTDFTATLDKFDFGSLTENATAKFEMIALWKKQLTDVECINLTTL